MRHSPTDAPVREVGAMTDDLNALADWLLACGVDVVALESTGEPCPTWYEPERGACFQRGMRLKARQQG